MSQLYRSGIQTENSDIRAHVSVVNQEIYIFKTKDGLAAIEKNNPPVLPATQEGADSITAKGWATKYSDIKNIVIRRNPKFNWDIFTEQNKMTTSEKGDAAVECVLLLIKEGRFPTWADIKENEDRSIQISGTDLIIPELHVQVKCDWKCGRGKDEGKNGTGNLFLQKSECNPFKRI